MYLPLLGVTILYGFIYLTKSSEVYSFIFTSGARQQTRKVNKDMSFVNNLILENHLSLLSLTLYTDTNPILITLGLALFISLVNCFLILNWYSAPRLGFKLKYFLSLGIIPSSIGEPSPPGLSKI